MFPFLLSLILCFHYFVLMCAKTATSFLVELISILKETVYRDGTVAVRLCLLLFIIEPAFVTSYSLPWIAKSSEIDLLMRKMFALKGANSFHCREANSLIWKLTPFVREAENKMAGLISL